MKASDITQIIIMIFLIGITFFVGFCVLDNVSRDMTFIKGFCIDKEGIYNLNDYNISLNDYSEIANCSNKKNPILIDTAIASVS